MVIRPVKTRMAIATAWNRLSNWNSLKSHSRSTLSAMAPAKGESSTMVNRSAKAMMPSHAPDSVSCHVSQPAATRWTQVPTSENELPMV